jgi:hypothetical protein
MDFKKKVCPGKDVSQKYLRLEPDVLTEQASPRESVGLEADKTISFVGF